jgi:hypothetical protein
MTQFQYRQADSRFERWGAAPDCRRVHSGRQNDCLVGGAEKVLLAPFLAYSALGRSYGQRYLGIGLMFSQQIDRILKVIERSGKAAVGTENGTAAYAVVSGGADEGRSAVELANRHRRITVEQYEFAPSLGRVSPGAMIYQSPRFTRIHSALRTSRGAVMASDECVHDLSILR